MSIRKGALVLTLLCATTANADWLPSIADVQVDYGRGEILIYGSSLAGRSAPSVTLGSTSLTVTSYQPTLVTALLLCAVLSAADVDVTPVAVQRLDKALPHVKVELTAVPVAAAPAAALPPRPTTTPTITPPPAPAGGRK